MLPMLEGKLLTVLFLAPGVILEPGVLDALHAAASTPAKRLAAQVSDCMRPPDLRQGDAL